VLAACGRAPASLTRPVTSAAPTRPTTAQTRLTRPSESADRQGTGRSASSPAPVVVTVASVRIDGRRYAVLSTTSGALLYEFSADRPPETLCRDGGRFGDCTAIWHPLLSPSAPPPRAAVRLPGRLGVLDDADGRQVTYNGHPLYTYAGPRQGSLPAEASWRGEWFFLVTPTIEPPRGCPPIC